MEIVDLARDPIQDSLDEQRELRKEVRMLRRYIDALRRKEMLSSVRVIATDGDKEAILPVTHTSTTYEYGNKVLTVFVGK